MTVIYLDSVGPKISFLSNQPTSTRSSPTIRWTSSENARFKCAIDNGQRQFVDCGEGFSGEWTGTNLPDGVTRFLVYGVDKTNNQGPTSEHQFTVGKLFKVISTLMLFAYTAVSRPLHNVWDYPTLIVAGEYFKTLASFTVQYLDLHETT